MLRGKRNWIVMAVAVLALSVGSLQAEFLDDMEDGIGMWAVDGPAVLSLETTNVSPNGGSTQALRIENMAPLGVTASALSVGGDPRYYSLIPDALYTYTFDYYVVGGVEGNGLYYGLYNFQNEEAGGGYDASARANWGNGDDGHIVDEWLTVSIDVTTGPDADHGYLAFFPAAGFGTVIIDNVSLTTDAVTLLLGDANRDGQVSAGDYASVQANFGNTGAENDPNLFGDANLDGLVSAGDYASVQANFGNVLGAAVPEPMTMTLLGLGGLAMLRRQRR